MSVLKVSQADMMLIFSSICLMTAFLTAFLKFNSRLVKFSLIGMQLCSFILLRANRLALIYQGDTSPLGFTMTRAGFFCVLFFIYMETAVFNIVLGGLTAKTGRRSSVLPRLYFCGGLLFIGMILAVVNCSAGFIFSLSETNTYVRGPGFVPCSLLILAAILLQLSVIFSCRLNLRMRVRHSLLTYAVLVITAGIIQYFNRGLSLNSFSFACLGLLLHVCAVYDNRKKMEEARRREMEAIEENRQLLSRMLGETTGALAGAIDAKDRYTHGHSRRVAGYAREIARRSGKSETDCERIYLSGLLHDVGKIGIADSIINKPGRLTDEEFAVIKEHPARGAEILKAISEAPYLYESALSHHERYDGRGYPNHLAGNDIPEFARIIAVADSYDAMTSNRSYRTLIPQEKVRSEIENGRGTQFDPQFADCMLQMIDEDPKYEMREK